MAQTPKPKGQDIHGQDARAQEDAQGKAQALVGRGRLKGRVAIVTGSDSGIGQAIAIAFAKEGADVVIARHKDRQGPDETRQQVEDAGSRATVLDLDQGDPRSVAEFFERARREMGPPDILVNDAGIDSTGKHVKDMDVEDMEREMRVNYLGPFYCTREFLRGLGGESEGRRASIINITSVHQEIPRAGASGYCAAKGALRNLTRCLALEVAGTGVRVNDIAPGMVLTPFNQYAREDPEKLRKAEKSIPMGRPAQPDEIARAAVFLASDESSYVHGETLFVDGGLRLFQGQGA